MAWARVGQAAGKSLPLAKANLFLKHIMGFEMGNGIETRRRVNGEFDLFATAFMVAWAGCWPLLLLSSNQSLRGGIVVLLISAVLMEILAVTSWCAKALYGLQAVSGGLAH